MIEHWLWLADRPRLGAIRAGELLARFGSAEAIYQTSDEALARAGVKPSVRAALADRSLAAAQKRFADCRAAGVPVANYGVALALLQGVSLRSIDQVQ